MKSQNKEIHCQNCEGRKNSIFCGLGAKGVEFLDRSKNINLYKRGQTLFVEGNPPFGLYCIHSGKLKLTKTNAEGKETIVRLVAEGDVLGHRSLFSETPYQATATVIDGAEICFINKKALMDLMKVDLSLALQLMQRMGRQMGDAEEKVASLAQKNLRERFAELLLVLAESYGEPLAGQKIRLNIKLTREEMASIIGAAPENLIRVVSDFKKRGFLEQAGKALVILDRDKVEEEAKLDH